MQCKAGIWVEKQGQHVPCGQCMACRINKGRLWTARILMEQAYTSEYSYFYSLTYDNDHVPMLLDASGTPFQTLQKKTFLKWVNNAKTEIGNFRYYAVGEYGEDSFRPHYHLAVFPQEGCQINRLRDRWQYGFTSISELNHERARYLANYTTKKLTKSTDERLNEYQEPEFRTSSRNPPLGSACVDSLCAHYAKPKAQELLKKRGDIERNIRIDSKIYPLGHWPLTQLRKKLGIPLTHKARIRNNPNYLDFHEIQEAECDLDEAEIQDKSLAQKKKTTRWRGSSQKI